MDIKDRIRSFARWRGTSVSAFERTCGFAHGYVRNIRNHPSESACSTIALHFPELSIRWLLTGQGAMLTTKASPGALESDERDRLTEMIRRRDERILELESTVLEQQRVIDELKKTTM